jgi:hypothetical protein
MPNQLKHCFSLSFMFLLLQNPKNRKAEQVLPGRRRSLQGRVTGKKEEVARLGTGE